MVFSQVIQTLLALSNNRILNERGGGGNSSRRPTPEIFSAVTFSAWLDMTCGNPGYRTEQYCTGLCLDQGSNDPGMHDAGWDASKGQCAARLYAGGLPISHPLLSPVHAGPELLALFPPTLLIVGGTEILMPENIELAMHAQAAGAPVSTRE